MKAIMARQNIGVADDGRLQLQDFGNISDLVRNIKNGNIELKQVFDSVPGELYLFKFYTEGRIDTFLTTTT